MSDDLRALLAKGKGGAASAKIVRLDALAPPAPTEPWGLAAMRGRLVELTCARDSATLTTAVELVLEAQRAAEPVAWIAQPLTLFYPQDLADNGVDLAALAVVRAPDPIAAVRAAEQLLRSGAFGLVVLDFGGSGDVSLPLGHLGRLVTLAQTHDAAAVCLTKKPADAPSLGSLVSLRAEALRRYGPDNTHEVTVRVLKDKRRGPGHLHRFKRRGPAGF